MIKILNLNFYFLFLGANHCPVSEVLEHLITYITFHRPVRNIEFIRNLNLHFRSFLEQLPMKKQIAKLFQFFIFTKFIFLNYFMIFIDKIMKNQYY